MKRKFIKKTVSAILSVLLILTLTLGISAHEMYYVTLSSGIIPIELRWINTYNGKYRLKVNGNYLYNSENINYADNYYLYSNAYESVKSAWNNCAGLIRVDAVSNASEANVIIKTPTPSTWYNLVGNNNTTTIGLAEPMDSNGLRIHNIQDAVASNGDIVYGTVYLHPNTNMFDNNTVIKATITHEIGHILGLGHTNGTYYITDVASVMKKESDTYYTPQAHDIADIEDMYG